MNRHRGGESSIIFFKKKFFLVVCCRFWFFLTWWEDVIRTHDEHVHVLRPTNDPCPHRRSCWSSVLLPLNHLQSKLSQRPALTGCFIFRINVSQIYKGTLWRDATEDRRQRFMVLLSTQVWLGPSLTPVPQCWTLENQPSTAGRQLVISLIIAAPPQNRVIPGTTMAASVPSSLFWCQEWGSHVPGPWSRLLFENLFYPRHRPDLVLVLLFLGAVDLTFDLWWIEVSTDVGTSSAWKCKYMTPNFDDAADSTALVAHLVEWWRIITNKLDQANYLGAILAWTNRARC